MPHVLAERDLAVFSRTWPPAPDPSRLAETIAAHGIAQAHLNLASAGLDRLDSAGAAAVRAAFDRAGVAVISISATYNMIDPDLPRRRRGARAAAQIVRRAPALGAETVSLCTGSRHPDDKWAFHPGNAEPDAYADLLTELRQLLRAARRAGVVLGIEPDPGNVIDTAAAADRLLRDAGGGVGVILDPGNLVTPGNAHRQASIIDEAFDLLGPRIVAVHAKDAHPHGTPGAGALGTGLVDFDHVFRRWALLPRRVPVVLHDLRAEDVPDARAFVLSHRITP
ncbi:sugar phosphate isomerase/epimerase family protein [Amycolatopsis rubida]|uniref:Sugar phosphate isomerase/epimerase n=1 Tax=Amycolatopsis rubida TaxID=112413 RepID=A0A1I5XJC9_9PSEU|nr:sugar phosphate isomerase/epimerase [Amycolatopsis rubida]SFQ32054.1 Sugar phosphate isomerase/epimerase [Amycolatopsis rubida]